MSFIRSWQEYEEALEELENMEQRCETHSANYYDLLADIHDFELNRGIAIPY